MQKIQRHVVDDRQCLRDAAANTTIKRKYQKQLQNKLVDVLNAYNDYDMHEGNPHALMPVKMNKVEAHALKLLYGTELGEYVFLDALRTAGKSKLCPVCGSQSGATLDHYLPKTTYPEYSAYSWNLIPACFDCNTHHSDTCSGTAPNERMIHPYYDKFVDQRILSVDITSPYWGAKVSFVPFGVKGADRDICAWHIENVINKTSGPARIGDIWGNIVRDKISVQEVFGKHKDLPGLRGAVKSAMLSSDVMFGGKNNWQSALLHGIQKNRSVLNWMLNR